MRVGKALFVLAVAVGVSVPCFASVASASPAQADWVDRIERLSNPCTGEAVTVAGTVHLITKTDSDGTVVLLGHLHETGVSNDGTRYVDNLFVKRVDDSSGFLWVIREQFVSEESSPNFLSYFTATQD